MSKKPLGGLGRGLGSMLEDVKTEGTSSIGEVEISKIQVNPNQPRTYFDEKSLEELASSIKELGIIQPITLRLLDDGSYQIISGERRFKASKKIGLEKIPAYIRTAADQEIMEMALIENVQREDLNPIEIALSYQRLIEDYDLTQDRLSERVGKKRSTITNYIGLLKLPAEIQMALKARKIDMGHAKTLVSLKDAVTQLSIYEQIVQGELPVRKVEELVRHAATEKPGAAKKSNEAFAFLENELSAVFDADVQIKTSAKGKGSISIPFKNNHELEKLLEIFEKLK